MVGPQEDERDSAGCGGEPATKWRSLKLTAHAVVAEKAMSGRILWLAVERPDGGAQEVGRPGRRGDDSQESEAIRELLLVLGGLFSVMEFRVRDRTETMEH